MKRFLLSAVSAFLAVSGFSQNPAIGRVSATLQAKHVDIPAHIVENQNPVPATQQAPLPTGSVQRSATEVEIGTTYYDLQTNSAIQRRIVRHPNNTITATWTLGTTNDPPAWTNRGTGYNFFNGTTWGTAPTIHLETERCGWPNPLITGQGKEIILSHNTVSNTIRKVQRNTVGSGTWTQSNLTNQSAQVWSRAVVGGTNSNTIHLVGMTLPEANDGVPYNGMDGAFLYTRSTDGGATWDIVDYQIPGTDSAYFDGFDGDSYHMDAKGNTVAIVVGGLGRGVQLFKSTNNGVSWTKTDVLLSDVWFDEESTFVDTTLADRLYTSDGSVNVLIDDNGKCHVWFGAMFIANTDLTDGLITYYPFTNSIDYWNEDFAGPYPISLAGVLDLNGNNVLDVTNSGGQYRFAGLASHPQAGIDGDGCIYVTYTALREDLTNGSQHYRHTYVMSTCDDGCTWSFPIDVTGSSNNDFVECAFPSIARRVDDFIHVLYMGDNEPGIAVSGDEDGPTINKMFYLKEDKDRFDTTIFCPVELTGDTFLCLGGSVNLHALGCANSYSWSGPGGFTSTSPDITVSALGTYTCTFNTDCGQQTLSMNVVLYNGTGGPEVNIVASTQSMCPGDTAVLTAVSNIGGVSYQWSANAGGATTASVEVYSTGTFTVTVSDCNSGSTIETIHISAPASAPEAIIVGDTSLCPGDANELAVVPVPGGSYLWSTGSTSSTTTVNAAGTYTVIVQNCAGTDNASIIVTAEALPSAAIDAPVTEACEGEVITVTASGGTSYVWSTTETSASISISDPAQSGTYTVTVSNDCGDTDTEEITLTVNPIPAAPVLTFTGTAYTSSYGSTGTHTWYVNNQVIGITGPTLSTSLVGNKSVYVVYTDENGCVSEPSNVLIGISHIEAQNNHISIYPNPNNGQFDIRFTGVSGMMNVTVLNAMGQTVFNNRFQVSQGQVEMIDLQSAEAGVYLIKVESAAGLAIESLIIE